MNDKATISALLKKYPPPRTGELFKSKWKTLLPKVTTRDNFSEAHLVQLEVLCDLLVEYTNLRDSLEITGHTYRNIEPKTGYEIVRNYPEVSQLNTCRQQIQNYLKMLGLVLTKDTTQSEEKEEKSEWA